VCSLSNLHADRHSDEATSSPQNATSTKSIKVRNSNSYIQIPSCRRRREGYRLACLVISHDLSLRMWCAITTPIATHLLCYHQTYRCFVIRRIVAVWCLRGIAMSHIISQDWWRHHTTCHASHKTKCGIVRALPIHVTIHTCHTHMSPYTHVINDICQPTHLWCMSYSHVVYVIDTWHMSRYTHMCRFITRRATRRTRQGSVSSAPTYETIHMCIVSCV